MIGCIFHWQVKKKNSVTTIRMLCPDVLIHKVKITSFKTGNKTKRWGFKAKTLFLKLSPWNGKICQNKSNCRMLICYKHDLTFKKKEAHLHYHSKPKHLDSNQQILLSRCMLIWNSKWKLFISLPRTRRLIIMEATNIQTMEYKWFRNNTDVKMWSGVEFVVIVMMYFLFVRQDFRLSKLKDLIESKVYSLPENGTQLGAGWKEFQSVHSSCTSQRDRRVVCPLSAFSPLVWKTWYPPLAPAKTGPSFDIPQKMPPQDWFSHTTRNISILVIKIEDPVLCELEIDSL